MAKTIKAVKPDATPKKVDNQAQSADTITQQLKVIEEKNNKVQLAEDRRLYKRFKGQIDKAYAKMETSYLETAFALHAIYKHKLYSLDNFKNIYDFAKENYNIARGTCNNFINICEKFGIANENGNIMELDEKYKGYGISQLAVMLAFPDELLKKCSPSCSVRSLKKMRQDYESALSVEVESSASLSDSTPDTPDENPENQENVSSQERVGSSDNANVKGNTEKLDIPVGQDSVFICKANIFDEMIDMQKTIRDTYSDIIKTYEDKRVCLELIVRIK